MRFPSSRFVCSTVKSLQENRPINVETRLRSHEHERSVLLHSRRYSIVDVMQAAEKRTRSPSATIFAIQCVDPFRLKRLRVIAVGLANVSTAHISLVAAEV